MNATETIGNVMTPAALCVDKTEMAIRARALMKTHEVRHLAVVSHGQIVGVLSERDLRLVMGGGSGVTLESRTPVSEICRLDPYIVETDVPLVAVLGTMVSRRIGSALVTKDGELAGIFTNTDACKLLAELLATA